MKKSNLSLIIGLVVGIILLAVWCVNFDFTYLADALRNLKINYIIWAGIFYLSAYFVRSIRWNLLLRNQVVLKIKDSWLISCAGNWLNYLIPIRAGELAKALLIKRIKHKSAVSVLPSVFIDKFFDTLGIFFILILIPLMKIKISQGLLYLIILVIIAFLIVFLILILSALHKQKMTDILTIFFAWLPKKWREKINELIGLFIDGLNIFEHHYTILLACMLITAVGVVFDGLYFWFVFRAFNLGTGFMIVLFGYTLINLSYIIPQPPAQLGSNEWMMIIIFSLGFGIDRNVASAVMVFAHLFTAVIITVLGILGFSYAGVKSAGQLKREL
ncbi:MAG TPA: lysylphosphatidylglycerol synthase transmembrane domain-containing protein [Candidatus Cloacimonadota bacterium]|nr:lysylphosphatidylglycerol synthase transmembrane domain-containing protein [Candidatus Cloacimonadota bacterium]HQL14148.1 lysylphosphatidylglycerol synthase transmembrane domain-containing protein [Candidatus Cloacimonadota bacterium]